MKPPLTIDDAHTPAQFAEWLQVATSWVEKRKRILPGRIVESAKVVRFIPREYIKARVTPKAKI